MQYRHLLLLGLCTQAGIAQAMGLGDMELQSFLGAPLRAEVGLLSPGQYDQQDIRVRIAKPETYERMGARYEAFHNGIEFDVRTAADGQIQILASSKKRVQEPFLDIVVELSWPGGTTSRRYNLLLDPPAYAMRWQKSTLQPKGHAIETAAIALARRETPPQRKEPTPVAVSLSGETYQVRRGDSLWKIAKDLRSSDQQSVHEVMAALYRANPQAFIAGDRDRLKMGVTLQLPSFMSGDESFQQQIAVRPVAKPSKQYAVANVPESQSLDIKAELVSAQQQVTQAIVPDSAADIQAAILRLQQEKAELRQFQAQVKDEMVQVLEQRIAATAALQQAEQLQQTLATQIASPAAPVDRTVQAAVAMTPAAKTAPQRTLPAQESAPAVATKSDLKLRDLIASTASDEMPPNTLSVMAAQDLLQPTPHLSNRLIADSGNTLWYLVAMVPLGILVVLMGMRSHRVQQIRRSEQVKSEDLHELVFGARRDRSQSDSPEQIRQALSQIREKADNNDRRRTQEAYDIASLEARDDVKQMIDLYLLYSQYQKALNVVLTEISKHPGRADLRLNLMQVYAEMGDWKAFEEQEEVLRRLGQEALLDKALRLKQEKMA